MRAKYIWTNHALKRLSERKISRSIMEQTLYRPDKIIRNKDKTVEQQKRIDGRTAAAILKENERGEKIIVSCWINPPYPGTKDHRKRMRYFAMQKASPMKKLWLTFLNRLGL